MLTQIQVINKILSTGSIDFIIQNNITEDYFTNYRKEFRFIMEHYKKYNNVPDTTTFLKSFPDFEIIVVNEPADFLIGELYKDKNETFLVNTFNKVKDLLMNNKTDEAMELFSASSQKVPSGKRLDAINILEDTSRYQTYLDKCNNFDKYYIPTGFRELDDALGGGIDRKNAYFVISARPGIGKTLVMVKFAAAAVEKGLTVGLYEGEMAVDKVAGRYDTLTSHISNSAITHGNIGAAVEYKKYLENLNTSKPGKFYILTRDMIDSDKVTVDTLSAFVDKYNLDVLFVDQLSLLDSNLRGARSFEQAADISKALKNLQTRKHIPIIIASQLNREKLDEGAMAGTENLSLSDRIGQDATDVISLTKKDDIMKIYIAKARDGAKKYDFTYQVDFDKGRFNYISDEEENEPEDDYLRVSYDSDDYDGEVF